jgi:hypothetical protein
MWPRRLAGRFRSLLLPVVVLLSIAGHDCVVPLPVAAAAAHAAGHHDLDRRSPGAGGPAGEVHGADCDPVATVTGCGSAAPVVVVVARELIAAAPDAGAATGPRVATVDRPPKFLLHASLLI